MARVLEAEFSAQEKEALYTAWGIPLDAKRRKWQLLARLWDPHVPVLSGQGVWAFSAEGEASLQALRSSALLTYRLLKMSPPTTHGGGSV